MRAPAVSAVPWQRSMPPARQWIIIAPVRRQIYAELYTYDPNFTYEFSAG